MWHGNRGGQQNMNIKWIITDRHVHASREIHARAAPDIEHRFDVWHVAKGNDPVKCALIDYIQYIHVWQWPYGRICNLIMRAW